MRLFSYFNGSMVQRFPHSAICSAALLLVCLVVISQAGCARLDPKPLSASANAEKLEERSLTNAALRAFVETNLKKTFPEKEWNLESLTWAAFFYHPSLELARAQWMVARGGEVTAG